MLEQSIPGIMVAGGMMMGAAMTLFFGPDAERRRRGKMNLTYIPVVEFLCGVVVCGGGLLLRSLS